MIGRATGWEETGDSRTTRQDLKKSDQKRAESGPRRQGVKGDGDVRERRVSSPLTDLACVSTAFSGPKVQVVFVATLASPGVLWLDRKKKKRRVVQTMKKSRR